MAALDAALGVTSRQGLVELAQGGRSAEALRRIADEPEVHSNAVVFMRILAETTAAVLVTVALTLLFDSIWWAMLAAAVIMTGVSFVLVGASPRTWGRQHAKQLLVVAAPVVRGVRIILGPLAHGLVALGNRVTPGVARGASFASEEQLLDMVDEAASQDLIEEDDRELIHSVFEFTDTIVREVMVPRTDMVTVDAAASTREAMRGLPRQGRLARARSSTTTPTTSSGCCTSRTSCSSGSATRQGGAMRRSPASRAAPCSFPSR